MENGQLPTLKRGRPSIYDAEVADAICQRLSDGESLNAICNDKGMPHESTVRMWYVTDAYPEFSTKYARAREVQAERWADEIVSIADDGTNDSYLDEDGNTRTDYDVIARSKLRVDARKWLLSKLLPKRYGDSPAVVQTNIQNNGGTVELVVVMPRADD